MSVCFFESSVVYLVEFTGDLKDADIKKLRWLLQAKSVSENDLTSYYIGSKPQVITPWSTNAVDICCAVGLSQISRIEFFRKSKDSLEFDPMIEKRYRGLSSKSLEINYKKNPIEYIKNIRNYNEQWGLALSSDELKYLDKISQELGRPLTDSEVFGFAQINSEHCRHKIFNAKFTVDSVCKSSSLFDLIKKTLKENPGKVVTHYNDNVAFLKGPKIKIFVPKDPTQASFFTENKIKSVLSLKAETHNFPTTVEPFNGAATGSGGEIRDRMAGGRGSIPLVGTACYMTSYPRLQKESWNTPVRDWLYQSPQQILTKASNGVSDYGNKFGQPLINGSLLTFEHQEKSDFYGFDKTIMLAGGVGYAAKSDAFKKKPKKGDKIILLGGDNYRIGMGGGAVSSVETGNSEACIELNAIQRSNPEMEKRVFNTIRALVELRRNPVVLIHDHGAGGHVNCLSELIEHSGGIISMASLPLGDLSLSDKEIIGNESQERMGLVLKEKDVPLLMSIAQREKTPAYIIGTVTEDKRFVFENENEEYPIDVHLDFLFSRSPKLNIQDETVEKEYPSVKLERDFLQALKNVLKLEGVGCKDWLTNKVDRSVGGKVVQQQCVGPYQLPLHGAGVVSLDFQGTIGIAHSMGHAPVVGLIDKKKASRLSIIEALTNIAFVPLTKGLSSVSLSANWMWACQNKGEYVSLYHAVSEASQVAIELGINISTGKDSLSMNQVYPSGQKVQAPGTVIISAMSPCSIYGIVTPDLKEESSEILYINVSNDKENHLGGSSLAQTQNKIGSEAPTVKNLELFKKSFEWIQQQLKKKTILAGQDVSSGGVLVVLLEMSFAGGIGVELLPLQSSIGNLESFLFCEKPAFLIQVSQSRVKSFLKELSSKKIQAFSLAKTISEKKLMIPSLNLDVTLESLFQDWYAPSAALEVFQAQKPQALERLNFIAKNPLHYIFPQSFKSMSLKPVKNRLKKAAIIRDKGTNGEREMAYSLYVVGFDVKDVTMTDLAMGKTDLSDVQFVVFCGGFSNSDVLGSARGWAGNFLYQNKAKKALKNFYQRKDTLSLGVCNGCQLMVLLGLTEDKLFKPSYPPMLENLSQKFESSFLTVDVSQDQGSILLKNLEGSRLGVWVAHKEGRFDLPSNLPSNLIALKYSQSHYPANPNGSVQDIAGICSQDGRHLAMMPHLERSIFSWQWPYVKEGSLEVTPWLMAFQSALDWVSYN